VQLPVAGCLLQEPQIIRAKVVQARLDDCVRHVRTEMRAEPAGGSSEATIT
jgi:hypothetical protein